MLVKIEEIQEPGLELTEPLARGVLDEALAESVGFSLVAPGTLKVSFRKVSGRVHLSGGFETTVQAPCKRCNKAVSLAVPVAFSLRMVPSHEKPWDEDEDEERAGPRQRGDDDGKAGRAGTFELDEVDAEPFDGKTIDLDPIVREQVLLALPVSVVCRDDCKGLCARCGQDLNEKDCGHGREREIDPRLAGLKDIKLQN